MELILLQDVAGLGLQYDLVTVKNGYGRNYLIPKKLAAVANKASKAMAAERMKVLQLKEERMLHEIEDLVGRIKEKPIIVGAKTGTTEKIFGAVTNVQLAEAIKRQTGIDIDRRKIEIVEEVKTLGLYTAQLNFIGGRHYTIEFEVVAE
ncbi:MAG: 50S ribosomal protein L9 [Chitinophagales bacterium]|mgnify:CR=1 FL=1|jgi:large subunit ribosomal protein L9|nr:50S ribosomal protein L9 [Sphingobacteriales bacterium]MBP9141191.1 50S ribosomal protein L9 [Chitinophagales bacterium]MDA0198133.1 50S ribosomal protein L9 [Bacteroidota bacterium]MBK6889277.1 50S ribosomal protein L9 [Sphingobacteriales bacterium]MBK8679858.1 50S ribosomal protein L9 [Sphingobacteriales bacterium]